MPERDISVGEIIDIGYNTLKLKRVFWAQIWWSKEEEERWRISAKNPFNNLWEIAAKRGLNPGEGAFWEGGELLTQETEWPRSRTLHWRYAELTLRESKQVRRSSDEEELDTFRKGNRTRRRAKEDRSKIFAEQFLPIRMNHLWSHE
jgi:hypothetical protein